MLSSPRLRFAILTDTAGDRPDTVLTIQIFMRTCGQALNALPQVRWTLHTAREQDKMSFAGGLLAGWFAMYTAVLSCAHSLAG